MKRSFATAYRPPCWWNKPLVCWLFVLCISIAPAMAGQEGLVPPADAWEYPFHAELEDFSVGAKVLSRADVERRFASTLNDGYVVVEVAFYPKDGKSVEVSERQFILHDQSDFGRAASAADVARALQKGNAKPQGREITVYPQVGIGYSSGGPYGRGGWYSSTGVGVGVGQPEPEASTDADRKTMETELREKGLPGGTITKPAAGYLYFPLHVRNVRQSKLSLELRAADAANTSPVFDLDLH